MKFSKEVTVRRSQYDARGNWRKMDVNVKRPTLLGYAVLGLASIPVVGGIVGDSYMDIFGDKSTAAAVDTDTIQASVRSEARQRYDKAYKNASPAGKFALQYLTETKVVVKERITEPNNGNGALGLWTANTENYGHFETRVNDGCLNKTAYDINGGDINGIISGLFVSGEVKGEVPTAAAFPSWHPEQPDLITIHSGHADSIDLTFTGVVEDDHLTPANKQTADQLATWNCTKSTFTTPLEVDEYTESSAWVK